VTVSDYSTIISGRWQLDVTMYSLQLYCVNGGPDEADPVGTFNGHDP